MENPYVPDPHIDERLIMLVKILQETPINYADSFKEDIYRQIADMELDHLEALLLSKLQTEEVLRNWINKLTSRIVMNEERAGVNEIIWDYINNG